MPYHSFDTFKQKCGDFPQEVVVISDVLKDASNDFGLTTKTRLLEFIANDGLEEIEFINSKEWENNPDRSIPIIVDAYKFKTISTTGYIAFFYSPKTNRWVIKSFHISDDINPAMLIALQSAGVLPKETKK